MSNPDLSTSNGRKTNSPCLCLVVIKNHVALIGAFATDDQDAYLDAWQSVDFCQGNPYAVAKGVFGGEDLKTIIEELNNLLIA